MKQFIGVCLAIGFAVGQLFADTNSATLAPSYEVNRAVSAPVIDGVVGVGEWDAASLAAGNWVNLQAHTPDDQNLRFQAMWDADNLYILTLSDYAGFINAVDHGAAVPNDPESTSEIESAPDAPAWNSTGYNLNFYLDPNTDGERIWTGTDMMDGASVPNNVVDGYEIGWDVFQGFAARRPTLEKDEQALRDPLNEEGVQVNDYFGGLFLEAHANDPFGNAGLWEQNNSGPNQNYRDDSHPGLVFAQNASNEDVNGTGIAGLVSEFAISWDSLNATNPNKLVTEAEAAARGPEMILDEREFIEIPDPDFPNFTIEVENPDFGTTVPNVGQFDGILAWIGEAGEPDKRFADPESAVFIDNGLYVEGAPQDGDVWAFEVGAITDDTLFNRLPSWSEPLDGDPSRDEFGVWAGTEHGRLLFVDAGGGCDPNTGGDLDGNGRVEFADFLVLSGSFGKAVDDHTGGDIDCNGTVGFADFLVLSGNFGKDIAAAQSVPEPSGLVLLSFAGIVCGLLRRRRS